jgi:hypothetical protein
MYRYRFIQKTIQDGSVWLMNGKPQPERQRLTARNHTQGIPRLLRRWKGQCSSREPPDVPENQLRHRSQSDRPRRF